MQGEGRIEGTASDLDSGHSRPPGLPACAQASQLELRDAMRRRRRQRLRLGGSARAGQQDRKFGMLIIVGMDN